jgi:hypothetical protein
MSYVSLATTTLGSAASSVTFSSIPATYKDLVLVVDCAVTNNADMGIQLNADTGSNYSQVVMRGFDSTTSSGAATYDRIYWALASISTSSRFAGVAQFMDYSMTDKHKTALTRSGYGGSTSTFVEARAARWANTNAVTSVKLILSSGSFASNSTFSLYGVA